MMPEARSIPEECTIRLDEAEILARVDGDWQLLADLCDLAQAELPRMIHSLAEEVNLGNANAVHRAAHRLKGSLSIFGTGPQIEDCLSMEELALKEDLSQTPELLSRLERHLEEFSAAVAALGKESHARADCG
jgi:HPt (histidine-containing phosphotransfer) domain-containing protein